MNIQTNTTSAIDFNAIKTRQQATWASGNYAAVGATLQIVGETLCEAVDLRGGERVLDVAAGNGNASLAAARRFAEVTSTDYVPALLERGRARAQADGFDIAFKQADVENLPFADDSFDVVLSTFGVMFAPNQPQAAREMLRVCRPGGRIGLACWTPAGFIGELFRTIGKHVAPPAGLQSPALWGDAGHLGQLFGPNARVSAKARTFVFRYKSPAHWFEIFSAYYGPVLKALENAEPATRAALKADIMALLDRRNTATDGTLVAPSDYLEAVVTKSG